MCCKWEPPERLIGLPTEREMLMGLERYNKRAKLSLEMMKNGQLDEVLTPLLRLFKNCKSFQFATVDYNRVGRDMQPLVPDGIMPAKDNCYCDVAWNCNFRRAIHIMNIFVRHTIACMVRAGCAPQRLVSNQQDHDAVDGLLKLDTWEDLKVTDLRELVIQPVPDDRECNEYFFGFAPERTSSLIQRSLSTLKILQCNSIYHAFWTASKVALPKLRSLTIGRCEMPSAVFINWMSIMPSLEHISVKYLYFVFANNLPGH